MFEVDKKPSRMAPNLTLRHIDLLIFTSRMDVMLCLWMLNEKNFTTILVHI